MNYQYYNFFKREYVHEQKQEYIIEINICHIWTLNKK